MSEQQKLIDIMFSTGLTIAKGDWFKGKTNEEIAGWIADQLRACGFDTQPCGASWGVLTSGMTCNYKGVCFKGNARTNNAACKAGCEFYRLNKK